jgi:hypothetical protein
MDGPETALAAVLGSWLLIAAVAQLSVVFPWLKRLNKLAPFGLAPRYHFFAPTPGTTDYHLLARARTPAGELSAWVDTTPWRRRWYNFLWNPDRRAQKALHDLATTLLEESKTCSARATQVSVPYLALLNRATAALASSEEPRERSHVQFLIALSTGTLSGEPAKPVFVSSLHPVG